MCDNELIVQVEYRYFWLGFKVEYGHKSNK